VAARGCRVKAAQLSVVCAKPLPSQR
jgi:hypothetical protein